MYLIQRAERHFTAIDAMDLDAAAAMISPTADVRTPMGAFTGREAFRAWLSGLCRTLPDMRHVIRGLAVEWGQTLAFEWRLAGTFAGPLRMPGEAVPPTGKRLDIPGSAFWQFEGGLIVAYHVYFDQLEFLRQLGVPSARHEPIPAGA
jgi:steroid delta-isomerase-like uncharacterized protein